MAAKHMRPVRRIDLNIKRDPKKIEASPTEFFDLDAIKRPFRRPFRNF